ncbi:hypothetical protein LCGC14_2605150, partial [marine sediment metagenome]
MSSTREVDNINISGVATMTSPHITTSIQDTNGVDIITLSAAASAVNEIQIANSITTSPVAIDAVGDDANIGLNLSTKGTGALILDGGTDPLTWPSADGAANDVMITNGAGVLSFT